MSIGLYIELLGCIGLTLVVAFVAICTIWFAVSTYDDIRKMIACIKIREDKR